VLIAKDSRPVRQKAYGYADRESKTLNNLDTRFRLGSMNKMFTSVSIAQLVQAGKLKYTDTIADVLPDYPNKEVARKITIHQLLTHTSGLGDIFGPEFQQKKDSLHDIKDLMRFAEALRSHKLLNAELTETVITGKRQPGPDPNRKYAYGFEEHFVSGHRVVGHGGCAPGMNGMLDVLMDNGYTVVVLANLDPPAAQNVASYISERMK
jgi:CubicO group peptidase (beta-lactamase class C family)